MVDRKEPLQQIADELDAALPGAVLGREAPYGQLTLTVEPAQIRAVCRWLKEECRTPFTLFLDICGVDHFPREPRFEVVYHVYAFPANLRLRLKAALPSEKPELDSVVPVWSGAGWFEREVYDMLGVRFTGHPDLRRILNPDGYGDHPLRKDFPLRGKFRIESPDDLTPWETRGGARGARE